MKTMKGIEISKDGLYMVVTCKAFADISLEQWLFIEQYLKDASGIDTRYARIMAEDGSKITLSVKRNQLNERYCVVSLDQRRGVYGTVAWNSEDGAPIFVFERRIVCLGSSLTRMGQIDIGEA